MSCYRNYKTCEEMEAMASYAGNKECVICMGVIAPDARESPGCTKRLCMVDGGELDVEIDFADVELLVIQSVIANGMLNVLQRARFTGETNV